jgi:hypothetical protein
MNTTKKIILMLCFLLACLSAGAQKRLNIEVVFENYGKKEGSILIELSKDALGNYTKINRYQSLIINSDPGIADICAMAIINDIKDGSIMLESKKGGKIETAYYCLKKDENVDEYEYILFTNKKQKITLIYLKGDFKPKFLETELNRLKNLFIKVNNKQIKL